MATYKNPPKIYKIQDTILKTTQKQQNIPSECRYGVKQDAIDVGMAYKKCYKIVLFCVKKCKKLGLSSIYHKIVKSDIR